MSKYIVEIPISLKEFLPDHPTACYPELPVDHPKVIEYRDLRPVSYEEAKALEESLLELSEVTIAIEVGHYCEMWEERDAWKIAGWNLYIKYV